MRRDKWTLKHIISTGQFLDKSLLNVIFKEAHKLEVKETVGNFSVPLKNKILASVFYEPSTRTRFSFEAAMLKLGGGVISTENASHFSSAIKGESLADTIRIIGGYADIIVLRHPQEGSALIASQVSPVPIINAGDGAGEHPTQALLDLYTVQRELGKIDGLTIGLVGDLLYGRTIHSLIGLLSLYKNVTICLISPPSLRLPIAYRRRLKQAGISFKETTALQGVISNLDVLYITRVQKERFASQAHYEKLKDYYTIKPPALKNLKKHAIIMHPLPRVSEIAKDIDDDPRAAYFRQAKNGLYIRMALLKMLL